MKKTKQQNVSLPKELLHFNLFLKVPNRNMSICIDLSIQNASNGDKVEVDSAKTEIN